MPYAYTSRKDAVEAFLWRTPHSLFTPDRMKICSRCKLAKDETQFQRKRSAPDGLQNQCKSCRKETDRRTYVKRSEEQKERYRQANLRTITNNTRLLYEYLLEHPCVDCGELDPVVLEFAHVTGDKRSSTANYVRSGRSWNLIFNEVQKCEVRCANCHRRVTAQRNGNWMKFIWGQQEEAPT